MTSFKNQKVIIATHYLLYGAAQALVDYLTSVNKEACSQLLYVALPLITQRKAWFMIYENGSQTYEKVSDRSNAIPVADYLVDFIQTIWFIFFRKETYDVFIGVDGLNCLAGLFLKKIGKVKKVIFYSIDFVPIRFSNKLLNMIYHNIEMFCVTHADECWNVSPRIAEGREKFLHIFSSQYPQKVVPIGIWNKDIKKRQFKEIKKQQILFMGHLLEKQGVQLVLEAMPAVLKKIKNAHFLIIGGGEYEEHLKNLTKDLRLEKYVTFTGWIKNRKQIDEIISESAIAVATYKPEKEKLYNFTYYADPTKLKDYLGAGLPVVLTDISYNAKEIAEKKCGILVEYNEQEVAKALVTLLQDEKLLQQYRNNALACAKSFDWKEIFTNALS